MPNIINLGGFEAEVKPHEGYVSGKYVLILVHPNDPERFVFMDKSLTILDTQTLQVDALARLYRIQTETIYVAMRLRGEKIFSRKSPLVHNSYEHYGGNVL